MVATVSVVVLVANTADLRRVLRNTLGRAGIEYIDLSGKKPDPTTVVAANVAAAIVELHRPGMAAAQRLWRLHRAWPGLAVVGVSEYSVFWNSGFQRNWGVREVLPIRVEPNELLRAVGGGFTTSAPDPVWEMLGRAAVD